MSSETIYTEHLRDPETRVTWGVTWPRFAILAALVLFLFWLAL